MEWNDNLQKIINYVEENLQRKEEPINPEVIAKYANCSYSFFQKVFAYMNKISFAEYIRYRKLTLAGYELKSSNIKVIELSYKYGYDSPTSFTKAFQQFHGVTPKEARQPSVILQSYPKMQIALKQKYSWKLEQLPTMRLIGKIIKLPCSQSAQKIPEFWSQCHRDGTFIQLMGLDTAQTKGTFGIFTHYDPKNNETHYAIMVHSDQALPESFQEVILPETTWAIFNCNGMNPQAIQNGWKFLNEEWLVQYPFRHANAPEMEWYSDGNTFSEDYLSQIWIPIIEED